MKQSLSAWLERRVILLWAKRFREEDGFRYDRRMPGYLKVWGILDGQVEVRTEIGKINGRAGDWLLLGPGVRHQTVQAGTRLVSIAIVDARQPSPLLGRSDGVVRLVADPSLVKASNALLKTVATVGAVDRYAETIPACSLEDFLDLHAQTQRWLSVLEAQVGADANRSWDPLPPSLKACLRTLEQALPGPLPDLDDQARRCGLSLRRLEQLARQHLGQSLKADYQERRLEQIEALLLTGHLQAKEVAYAAGFSAPANFSNWFRQRTGLAPMAYRRAARRGI